MTDNREYHEIDFLQFLTQARSAQEMSTEISDDDHDIARIVAELNLISPHVTVKEINY